jgi:hypothetical protein
MEDGRERRGLETQMGRREWYGIGEERRGRDCYINHIV